MPNLELTAPLLFNQNMSFLKNLVKRDLNFLKT